MNGKERIFTKNFWLTFLSLFFCSNVMYMLMTTMTEYTVEFGASATMAGMVTGMYTIGGMLTRLYSGGGLQKYGWKRFAMVFMTIHFVACLGYFLVHDVTLLLIVRFVHGLGFGGAANAILTIGMSMLPRSRYGEASGYFMLSPTLAIASGPYLGGLVYDAFGSTGCFVAALVMSLLMLAFLSFVDLRGIDPGLRHKGESLSALRRSSEGNAKGLSRIFELKAVPISLCMFLFGMGYVAVMSFYRLYAVEVDLGRQFSYFFLIYAAVLILTRPVAGKLQDRFGDNPVIYTGIVAQTLGLVLIAWKPCMATIVLCALGCGLGYGTLNSACNSIVARQAVAERRSYAMATFWVFCDGGMGLGPMILGAVLGAGGFFTMYCVAAAVTLIALPLYWLCWGRSGGKRSG